MGPSFRWHPGSPAIGGRWSFPVALRPDEIFSSWLIRAAFAHGLEPLGLSGALWPDWPQPWAQDIDRGVGARMPVLSDIAGIPLAALKLSTLQSVMHRVGSIPPDSPTVWPWMLTLGSRNRRRRAGLQYCPECLKETDPYYRIQWRFAWHAACARHRCQLVDRCPHCGSAIEPHRLDENAESVATCATCRRDLSIGFDPTATDRHVLALQEAADEVVRTENGVWAGQQLSGPAWFEVLRYVVILVRRACRYQDRRGAWFRFLASLDIECNDALSDGSVGIIELRRLQQRECLLGGASRILIGGAEAFYGALSESGISRQAVVKDGVPVPDILRDVIAALPDNSCARKPPSRKPRYPLPRSKPQVLRMMTLLRQEAAKGNGS